MFFSAKGGLFGYDDDDDDGGFSSPQEGKVGPKLPRMLFSIGVIDDGDDGDKINEIL